MTYHYTSAQLRGDRVYLRGYRNGERFNDVVEIRPYMFLPDHAGQFRTLDQRRASRVDFESVSEARDFVRRHEGTELYGFSNFLYPFLNDEFPGTIEHDPKAVSVVSLDTEVLSYDGFPEPHRAEAPIVAVTLSKRERQLVFGLKPYRPKSPSVSYVYCESEKQLLTSLIDYWNDDEWSPDVVTGWNIDGFDIPYIVNRTARVLGKETTKLFSPWRHAPREREVVRGKSVSRGGRGIEGRTDVAYEIHGVAVLDYLELYKKFSGKNLESFSLDQVGREEFGEGKLDYSEYSSLNELYEKNHDLYIDYNLDDTTKVERLEKKYRFVELIMALAYKAKIPFNEAFTTTKPWDVMIHNYLMSKNIVVPHVPRREDNGPEYLVGGYVKDPKPGVYDWVVSEDFDSLYPHLIMQYNISPETIRDHVDFSGIASFDRGTLEADCEAVRPYLLEKNVTLAGNGWTFTRDFQGFLPEMMETIYAERVRVKNAAKDAKKRAGETDEYLKLNNEQTALKLILNSGYGALANQWFRYYDIRLAEAVTTSGQVADKYAERGVNAYLNKILGTVDRDYVVAADTDSLYIELGPLVEKVGLRGQPTDRIVDFVDEAVKERLGPRIERSCVELCRLTNGTSQKLKMKREAIADRAIWRAGKNYVLNVLDEEGVRYSEPKLKMRGIEAVKSNTPAICRDAIKKALKIIMGGTEDQYRELVTKFRTEFHAAPFRAIARPSSISNIEDYYDASGLYRKGTPMHVKGAILFNHMIEKLSLEKKYEPIRNRDKIKFAYLKTPNPLRDTVIAAPLDLPAEFGLDAYVDRDEQFEKTFLKPISSLSSIIGWKTEQTSSVEDFFS